MRRVCHPLRPAPIISLTLGLATGLWPGGAAAMTTLQRVLAALDAMGASPVAGLFANIAASTAPVVEQVGRRLVAGDAVIIGYDALGDPVRATATAEGVMVSESTASGLASGLAAGLYPPGSALYSVPPGGQLSLFQEAQDQRDLALATELVMTRIDGSVTNIITGIVPPELAAVYAVQQGPDIGLVLGEVQSTVIGSVNTGEIVTHLDVTASLGQVGGGIDLAMSEIAVGANQALDRAATANAMAQHFENRALGGAPDLRAVMVNLAGNAQTVTGAVTTIVQSQSVAIGDSVTTVIGAVNAGVIGIAPTPR